MVAHKSFQDIYKLIQEQDIQNGVFILTEFKPTLRNICTRAFLIIGIILELCFTYSAFVGKDLLLIILQSIALTMYISLFTYFTLLHMKKEHTQQMFDFCHEIYDLEKNFHVKVRESAKKHANIAYIRSRFLIKWTVILFYSDALFMTIGVALIGHFLPDNIYPKYSLPLPYSLSFFENQETPLAFYFTVFAQCICVFQVVIAGALLASTLFAVVFHLFAYMDIINEIIGMMGQEMRDHFLQVRKGKRKAEETEFDLKLWIPMIVDAVTNVGNLVKSLDAIFSGVFFLGECAAFGAFVLFGMVFLVLKKQYFLGVGATPACILIFFCCYVNEKILNKLSDITFNLYDVEWYNLSAKQRKFLLVTLNAEKLGIGFNSLRIHDLTLNRYATVARTAYTNCLVLKDIVLK